MLVVKIVNDNTGTEEIGNYNYQVFVNMTPIAGGRVEGHSRRLSAEWLINQVASDMAKVRADENIERLL